VKKIGAITIGQAPRTDVMEDLDDILRGDVELIQAGALDLLTLEEVETLRPDGTGNTLVSRMRWYRRHAARAENSSAATTADP
jgi:protein AroM